MTADQLSTARLDAPVADVEAQMGVLRAATVATHSLSDRLAYRMDLSLVDHPEWCSTEADYPGWTPAMGCCPAHTPAVTL